MDLQARIPSKECPKGPIQEGRAHRSERVVGWPPMVDWPPWWAQVPPPCATSCIRSKKYKTYRFHVSHNFSYFLWQNHPNYASPHAPVIVLKTSDCYTWEPDNPVVYQVSSGNPESSTFYNSHRVNNGATTILQHLIQILFIKVKCKRFTT